MTSKIYRLMTKKWSEYWNLASKIVLTVSDGLHCSYYPGQLLWAFSTWLIDFRLTWHQTQKYIQIPYVSSLLKQKFTTKNWNLSIDNVKTSCKQIILGLRITQVQIPLKKLLYPAYPFMFIIRGQRHIQRVYAANELP